MPRRPRAPYVKQALYKITKELAKSDNGSDGATSRKVVDLLKSRYKDDIARDSNDIIDVGLMVLAGRVPSMRASDSDQYDLLERGDIREFVDLRIRVGNRVSKSRVSSLGLKPDAYFAQEFLAKKEQGEPPIDKIAMYMSEMREKGLNDVTLGEYLKSL